MEEKRIDMEDLSKQTVETEVSAAERLAALKKKNIRRSIVSAISFMVVSVIIFSAQSFAYFSADVSLDPMRLAAGNVDIDLVEMMDDGHGGQVTYTAPVSVVPAGSYSKIVTVKNSGDLPVYVRVKLEKIANDPTGLKDGWEKLIACNFNTSEWTYKDGYYYYNDVLGAGDTTEALFDRIAFAASMGNEFVGKAVSFKIISEATQSNGNGSSAIDAQGWPVTH